MLDYSMAPNLPGPGFKLCQKNDDIMSHHESHLVASRFHHHPLARCSQAPGTLIASIYWEQTMRVLQPLLTLRAGSAPCRLTLVALTKGDAGVKF